MSIKRKKKRKARGGAARYLEKQAVDEALCSKPCEGDPSSKCGGPLYESGRLPESHCSRTEFDLVEAVSDPKVVPREGVPGQPK